MSSQDTMYKKKIIINIAFFALAGIFVFSIFVWVLLALSNQEIDRNKVVMSFGNFENVKIYDGAVATQSFIEGSENLSYITTDINGFYKGNYWVKVRAMIENEIIGEEKFMLNGVFMSQRFDFYDIGSSIGKKFIISLETNAPKEAPLVFSVFDSNDENTFLTVGEKTYRKSFIALKGYVNPKAQELGWNNFGVLVNRISQYKPWIFKGTGLILCITLYVLLLIAFLYYIIKVIFINEKE